MSSQGSSFGRSHGVLLSRLLWPTAILFASTLWFVVSTILWTGDGVNQVAIERERGQFHAATGAQGAGFADVAAELAAGIDEAEDAGVLRKSFDAKALALRYLDAALLLARDGTVMAGAQDGRPLGADGAVEAAARYRRIIDAAVATDTRQEGAARPAIAPRLHADERGPFFAVVVPVGEEPASAFVLAQKRVHPAGLVQAASRHGLAKLAIGPTRPIVDSHVPLLDGRGTIAAYATWSAERPGDLMRARLIPLTLAAFGVIVLLFGFVAGYLHWLARDVARTEARSRDLLGRDPLSGLANRLLFGERLDRELHNLGRSGQGLAVLFIDLDRFKDVNDTYGHQAGDDLIQLVAQRLINLLRSSDTIARFGGDEFAIIQTGLMTPDDAAVLGRRILDALTRPFALAHTQVIIGASIGVALAPQHGTGRETLMGLADTALYQAKSEGRNRFVFFQARMDETIRMRKVVEEDLRRAIAEDELLLHYQPLFSSDGTTVVAVEALVRWPHPVRGMISPAEFISIAEERGLVIPLGEWVMRRACRDGKRWPGIRVAVNVSPIQFRHRDFVAGVVALLAETGFEAGRLELELTEGVVVENADAAETAMMELRALGVHLALDDFGTGYSSLIYLRRFAFDTIKIDRSFLESMEATGESAILVHSMVHLGRALGLTVTAEGVETREQHRFLQALGCHQLQGFLFSRPVTATAIDAMLGIPQAATEAA